MFISLVGLPGGGKSTVGRHLARRLGMKFIDSDAEIEHQAGRLIRDIFRADGEEFFRDLEQRVIEELVQGSDCVLATGGGAVLRPRNRASLHERSTVVYLRSAPEELFRRLRHDTQRPMLQVADPLAKLKELHAHRDPLYRQTAHFIIDTGRPSVPTLVNHILMQLELAGILPVDAAPSPIDATPGG